MARRMKAVLSKYDVSYQVSRFQPGQELGDWIVIVRYADQTAYAKALDSFAHDPEHRQVVAEISKLVTLVKREMVIDLDL